MPGCVLLGWLYLAGSATPTQSGEQQPDVATPSLRPEATAVATGQHVDVSGEAFQLHFGLKAIFDRFIFAHPDLSQQALEDAYAVELKQLPYSLAAHDQALSLFSRYLSYKAELQAIDEPASRQQLSAVADRLDARDQLRFRFFSEREYHYLFSRDASYDKAALARLRIASDPDLSKQDKRQLIEAQLTTLPDEQQISFAPSLAVNRLTTLNQRYKNDNTLYQAVAAEFGHEVAQRMQTRNHQQLAWQQRVETYRQWESEINEDASLGVDEKERLIQAQRSARFNDNEVRRLQVFLENPSLIKG